VAHRGDVDPVGDEQLDERLGQKGPQRGDGHRTHPGDLADLAVLHVSAPQGTGVARRWITARRP
jgi:hypothetical protein